MKKFLAPSILNADFSNLSEQIKLLEIGGADYIHCDIMDGQFVPNLTFGPLILNSLNKITQLPLDAHLMIKNPENLLEQFAKNGADIITVHQEECVHLHRTITKIKDLNCKAGIALNPATPLSTITEIIDYVDLVLLMSVNPGFGGQKFIKSVFKKISEAKKLREENKLNFLIEVDGGIDKENVNDILKAGCDIFVIGSSIFKSDNISAATLEFKNLLKNI